MVAHAVCTSFRHLSSPLSSSPSQSSAHPCSPPPCIEGDMIDQEVVKTCKCLPFGIGAFYFEIWPLKLLGQCHKGQLGEIISNIPFLHINCKCILS